MNGLGRTFRATGTAGAGDRGAPVPTTEAGPDIGPPGPTGAGGNGAVGGENMAVTGL